VQFIEPLEFSFYQAGKLTELRESAVDEIFTLANVHHLMMGEEKRSKTLSLLRQWWIK
jgi:hypothetical protein